MADKNIQELYSSLKAKREEYVPNWEKIARIVGLTLKLTYDKTNYTNKSEAKDQYVDDPTAAISVNQAGDYTVGIMWGTGSDAFKLKPSRYVLEKVALEDVVEFYDFATSQALYHFNHENAGFMTAVKPYMYDQYSFGTSGVGCFKNQGFVNKVDDNALTFQNYGVDNTSIDEGKSGLIEYCFVNFHWTASRIVSEFAMVDGSVSDKKVSSLPKQIRDAWNQEDTKQEFNVVFGYYPREDFNPRLKGKRGTKYKGCWFLDDNVKEIFFEEDFKEKPIAIGRQIKIRGEVYGRSAGTMLISTINSVNFMVGETIEILEKLGRPSLGTWSNAIMGDSVLDTGSDTLNVFNPSYATGTSPIFPLYQVGDPTGIIQYLIPYLNEKIVTGFKVDSLLDFSTAKEMTATESLQRYAIRGKSLSGILQQQKIELLLPLIKRGVSILMEVGELGVDPRIAPELAQSLKGRRPERIIPPAVIACIEEGRAWYEVELNNELEKLTNTEKVQSLVQVIQTVTAIAALYPQIIQAVDWHKMLMDINERLDPNNQIVMSAKDFKNVVAQQAMLMAQQMQLQAGNVNADTQNKLAGANKQQTEAQNGNK